MLRSNKLTAYLLFGIASVSCVTAGDAPATPKQTPDTVVPLLELVLDADEATARECLGIVTRAAQNAELSPERIARLRDELGKRLGTIYSDVNHPLRLDAALLAVNW